MSHGGGPDCNSVAAGPCADVANLLLAAGTARHRELALKASIGSPRRRLMQQLLTEDLLLELVGGTAGLLLAFRGGCVFAWIPATSRRCCGTRPLTRVDPQRALRCE